MNIVYTMEDNNKHSKAIFLAGPTYRIIEGQSEFKRSWRSDAIDIFNGLGFSGSLYVPEWKDNVKPKDWTYTAQVIWEIEHLRKADVVLFWIPRNLEDLPAFTTNVEFGEHMCGNSVAGSPPDAVKNDYLKKRFELLGKPWFETLDDLCKYSIFSLMRS